MKRAILLFILLTVALIAEDLPKAAPGFKWQEFSKACVVLQVPYGWQWREKNNRPAQTVTISPEFNARGGYDSGFTLNAVVCHSEKEWKDAYFSSLQLWADTAKEIKALGKPTFEKVIQNKDKTMQVFVIEGDMYLPNAPHPKEKYRVRTIVRAIPPAGLVYVYSIGALVKDWDEIWKIGETMLEPIVFHLPDEKG
ncbi:hypothetical protein [Opitutus sp. GAS368]|uniref:hypothetical protein n=1 Tax=Opitutus sp. GAS368 TaxID=1882749 RepID=UPI00087C6728|nr:hypothetical protein [Opitutus sp. GAS368]SDS31965.1 hypothetical protein SAMN05444173_2533 [Opitutus sp. GAS368]